MKFLYRSGQRPLEGFTIKRGLGKGGFGEVYYAVSDGGKDVALKLIRSHTDIELRGIAACLNLKHPNLLHLYDLRTDVRGDHWLIMEYVQGETLTQILAKHTHGLSIPKVKEWFLQAARAVAYLHDYSIVHRDLKPGNLFIENDQVRIGDYGLSKPIGSATSLEQSRGVGTVYYMAPEIVTGNYSRQVDVYALGVTLFEMLTGKPPFEGDTWEQVANKHQTDLPDLTGIPQAFVPILEHALHKDPKKRYTDVEQMIAAVEALDRTSANLAETTIHPSALLPAVPVQRVTESGEVLPNRRPGISSALLQAMPPAIGKIRELIPSLAWVPLLSLPILGAISLHARPVEVGHLASLLLPTILFAWVALIVNKGWDGTDRSAPRWLQLPIGALLGISIYWLQGWPLPTVMLGSGLSQLNLPEGMDAYLGGRLGLEITPLRGVLGYMLYFGLLYGELPWSSWLNRHREARFSADPVFATAFWGVVLWLIALWLPVPQNSMILAAACAVGIAQLASPWHPKPESFRPKKQRLEPRVP
jgi:eukaryotic-like serine/threonine-protein kinase